MPPTAYHQIGTKQKNDIIAKISAFLIRQSEIIFAFLFGFQVIRNNLLFSQDDDLLNDFMVATARKNLDMAPLRRHYIREAMA